MQCLPLFGPCSTPARSPSSPFGKGSKAQKAGTRDAGPSALPPGIGQAAVRSVPSRDRAEARLIRSSDEKARRPAGSTGCAGSPLGLTARRSRCLRARSHQGVGMSFAFVFPGQGSQAVGMGKALADAFGPARAVFEEVDAALGEKLTRIIWEGPAETLTLTENAQHALMAVSLDAMRVLEAQAGVDLARDARFVAGHSLGEYSALAAAGPLTIADTARLRRIGGGRCRKRCRLAPAPWRHCW